MVRVVAAGSSGKAKNDASASLRIIEGTYEGALIMLFSSGVAGGQPSPTPGQKSRT